MGQLLTDRREDLGLQWTGHDFRVHPDINSLSHIIQAQVDIMGQIFPRAEVHQDIIHILPHLEGGFSLHHTCHLKDQAHSTVRVLEAAAGAESIALLGMVWGEESTG